MLFRISPIIILIVSCFFLFPSNGEVNNDVIHLRSRTIQTDDKQLLSVSDLLRMMDQRLWIVHYKRGESRIVRRECTNEGLKILDYVPDHSFLVYGSPLKVSPMLHSGSISWLGPYLNGDKFPNELRIDMKKTENTHFLIQIVDTASINETLFTLSGLPGMTIESVVRGEPYVTVAVWFKKQADLTIIDTILAFPDVVFLESYPQYQVGNADAAWTIQSFDVVTQSVPLWNDGLNPGTDRLNGENQIIGVCDTGVDADMCQFYDSSQGLPDEIVNLNQRKIIAYYDLVGNGDWDSWSLSHGTHVAGTLAGNDFADGGTRYYGYPEYDIGDGMGLKTKLVIQDAAGAGNSFSGVPIDLTQLFQQTYDAGARIHSNSWGSSGSHYYTAHARHIDQFTWDNQDFLIVFLAGNDGNTPGVIWEPSTAKNCISVGATWNDQSTSASLLSPNTETYDTTLSPNDQLSLMIDTDLIDVTFVSGSARTAQQICNDINAEYQYTTGTLIDVATVESQSVRITSPTTGQSSYVEILTVHNELGWAGDETINGLSWGADSLYWVSSYGPTLDNRLKPTVVAPGVNLYSSFGDRNITTFNCDLYWSSGTSMSTPVVAGVSALVREYFEDGWYPTGFEVSNHAFSPLSSLVKAVIINSGVPINYRRYYDYTLKRWIDEPINGLFNNEQGWGRPLLDNSLFFSVSSPPPPYDSRKLWVIQEEIGIIEGQTFTYEVPVLLSSEILKITLVWNDYPSSCAASINLVNNLDLEVTTPGLDTYLGNVISNNYSVLGGSPDDRNVEEQVILSSSEQGLYTISVVGTNVPFNPQPFALVVSGDLNMNPQGSGGYSYGLLSLDKRWYAAGQTGLITLYDPDVLGSGIVTVEAISTTESLVPEQINLSETPSNSGYFTGLLPFVTGTPVLDGQLQVNDGDTVTVTYTDADDGFGNTNIQITATALINDSVSVITNVTVESVSHHCVEISWDTDEISDSTVIYGSDSPPSATETKPIMDVTHLVQICDLDPCMTYFFSVQSTNDAGETGIDDNGGSYYTFQTKAVCDISRFDITYCPSWTMTGDWECAEPQGLGGDEFGQADPTAAPSKLFVFGNDVTGIGSVAGDYDPSVNAVLTTQPLDFSLNTHVYLRFQQWLNVEQGFYDVAKIEISTNGTDWNEVWRNWDYITDNNWLESECDLTSWAAGQSSVQIRWVLSSDSSLEMSGWNIDDVRFFELTSCEEGILRLDTDYYSCSDMVTVKLFDIHLNSDPYTIETCSVEATSDTMPTPLTVQLSETAPNSAHFSGSFQLSPQSQIGMLTVTGGDTLVVTYNDANGGGGLPSIVTASALVRNPQFEVFWTQYVKDANDLNMEWFWSQTDPLASFFTIRRSLDPANFVGASEDTTLDYQWTDVGIINDGNNYYYLIHASNDCGNGP